MVTGLTKKSTKTNFGCNDILYQPLYIYKHMNNKITNPFLKQMISEIANKSSEGRLVDINWTALNEGKKKSGKPAALTSSGLGKKGGTPKPLKSDKLKEAAKPEEAPKDEPKDDLPELPDLGGADKADAPKADAPAKAPAKDGPPADSPAADAAPAEPAADAPASEEDADAAEADAAKAKAELEKARAEKDRAEKEIEQHAYIKLGSNAGVQFLLGKILDHAFKTNTIDALAGEMVQKLKIQTPEDMNTFSEDTAAYRVIPGMPELLASMKTLATKQPDTDEESTE